MNNIVKDLVKEKMKLKQQMEDIDIEIKKQQKKELKEMEAKAYNDIKASKKKKKDSGDEDINIKMKKQQEKELKAMEKGANNEMKASKKKNSQTIVRALKFLEKVVPTEIARKIIVETVDVYLDVNIFCERVRVFNYNLKINRDLRLSILSGELSVKEFVAMSSDDMRTNKRKLQAKQHNQEAMRLSKVTEEFKRFQEAYFDGMEAYRDTLGK